MVGGGGKRLRIGCHIHQSGLDGWAGGKSAADQEDAEAQHIGIMRRQPEDCHQDDVEGQHAADRAVQGEVCQTRADNIADIHADAEQCQHDGHSGHRHHGDIRGGLGNVAEHGKHAAEADGGDGKRQPHLDTAEGTEFAPDTGTVLHLVAGLEQEEKRYRQQRNAAHHQEGCPPGKQLTEEGCKRRAEKRCDGEAQHDPTDGTSTLVNRRHRCGHKRSNAKIGAVWQAGDEAQSSECPEVRCKGA